MRELLLLRHAKAAGTAESGRDFDRPLSERGKRDAPAVGRWMLEQGLLPDAVVSSPAKRARQTARRAVEAMGLDPDAAITWEPRVYDAGVEDLRTVLAAAPPEAERVLLVGHNPGLVDLLGWLADDPLPVTADGKVLPTCAVARLRVPGPWAAVSGGSGRLLEIRRVPEA